MARALETSCRVDYSILSMTHFLKAWRSVLPAKIDALVPKNHPAGLLSGGKTALELAKNEAGLGSCSRSCDCVKAPAQIARLPHQTNRTKTTGSWSAGVFEAGECMWAHVPV